MSIHLDHRQLADEMEIFFFDEQIGAGLPVWLPNGVAIREALEAFIKNLESQAGYQRVASPHVAKAGLFQQSGHLRSFHENMFPPMQWPEDGSQYFLKPMNCPYHHKVFSSCLRSYRQLPLRIAEYGQVYRYENSGSLRGLSRVRGLCQNDAHIYLVRQEALAEIENVLDLHEKCYSALGLKGYRYRLSKHDSQKMENFDGPIENWIQCEEILRQALIGKNLPFFEAEGEAAFYGPKIDVQMQMGACEESIASVQLDFNSAEKFNLNFVDKAGESQRPWIVHRAPLGSHERFIALLLEYFCGQLPGWLSPIQILILPVKDESNAVVQNLADECLLAGLRLKVDNSSGRLSKRIHFAHKCRPFAKVIVGPKEISSGLFSLQLREQEIRGSAKDLVAFLKEKCQAPVV